MSISRRKLLITGAALGVAAPSAGLAVYKGLDLGGGSEDVSESWTTSAITAEQIGGAAPLNVFFGHQSVGMNVIGGVPGVFAAHGMPAPEIIELDAGGAESLPRDGHGRLAHAYIGENGDPLGKIRDFDARIRGGLGEQVDVALMKFCYIDVTAGVDVDAVFRAYSTTLAALERDFPDITFVHVTAPLTTEPEGPKAALKRLLGRPETSRPDNVSRERLNGLIRQAYDAERLFDLAALESTRPDGTEVSGTLDGKEYHALYSGFAADNGHLNDTGSRLAAARLFGLLARASRS